MAIPRRITKRTLAAAPDERWNAFVDLCFRTRYDELTPLQRTAHLAFWYESEVSNGGHAQFFDNVGNERAQETIQALNDLGAIQQAQILSVALDSHLRDGGGIENWTEETIQRIHALDSKYYATQPTMNEVLESFLEQHQDSFVEVVEDP